MALVTRLFDENFTVGTGNVFAAFQTAAAGNAASRIEVVRMEIWQIGTTTLEMIRGQFATRDTAGTLTMTATTPTQAWPIGGPASGLTGNTAPAGAVARSGTDSSADSGGAYTAIQPFGFANTAGYLWKPDNEHERIVVPASTLFVVRLLATPTGTTGWGILLILREDE